MRDIIWQVVFKPNVGHVRCMSQASAAEQYTKVSEDEKGIRTIQLNDPKKRYSVFFEIQKSYATCIMLENMNIFLHFALCF